MRSAIFRDALLALCFLGIARPAAVGAIVVPSPSNSTTPACIRLVGSNGSQPAWAFGQFEVIFRDLANNPIPDALIVVDLSAIPELAIAADQLDSNVLVNCGAKTAGKRTEAIGRAVFSIVGGGRIGVPAATLLNGGRIYANGVLLASPTISAFDLDGQHGLGATDLTQFLDDFASELNYGRCDFDCNGSIGVGDLVVWLTAFGSGTQVVSASVNCP